MNKYLIFALILFSSCSNSQSLKEEIIDKNNYPEKYGFDSEVLIKLLKAVEEEKLNVNSVLIQKNTAPVLDAHFYPQKAEYLHDVASITKSITSLLIGITIDKGYIKSVDQKVVDFFPNSELIFNTEEKKSITIEHLLTMTSGICSDFSQGESLRENIKTSSSPLEDILSSNLSNNPGEQFTYCSAGVQLLSILIEESSGMKMEVFAKNFLFKPLEIENYKFGTDLNGYTNASGDIYLTAGDLAKIGQLILNKGSFNSKQVISKKWIEQSTTPKVSRSSEESYGYLWWLREDLGGLIEAQGRGGQRLIILPEKELVVVMYGTGFDPGKIGGYIVEALKSDASMEPNPKGNKLLKNQLDKIENPYSETKPLTTSLIAKKICGKKYMFEENSVGFTHFTLCAEDSDSAHIVFGLNIKKTYEIGDRKVALGLDGQYKISNATRFRTPMAARAEWIDNDTIIIDYNEFSNAHKYNITISFEDDRAIFKIEDEADYGSKTELFATSME